MTTIRTIKSITSTLLLSGIVIFSSCKKDDDVDPRDAYVGEYDMEFECGNNFTGEDELEIEKDPQDAKLLLINSDLLDFFNVEDLEAEISGGKIVIKETDFTYQNQAGETKQGEISGEGSLTGKTLTIDFEFSGDVVDECEYSGDKK